MNLEALIEVIDDEYVDERALRKSLRRVLSNRSTPDDFELHFSMFVALPLLEDYGASSELLDYVDAELVDYITTCRTSGDADTMLCDLIVDHWPVGRSIALARELTFNCRYPKRREAFWRELRWHGARMRPDFRQAMSELAVDLAADSRPTRRKLADRIADQLTARPERGARSRQKSGR